MKNFKTNKIVNLKGKDYILFEGLLEIAHNEYNIQSIETELIQLPSKENQETAVFKAVCKYIDEEGREKVFTGYGDANPSNVNKMIAVHSIRMAETRAIARALRMLTGAGTVFEELGDISDLKEESKPNYQKQNQTQNNASSGGNSSNRASDKQLNLLKKLIREYAQKSGLKVEEFEKQTAERVGINSIDEATTQIASGLIKSFMNQSK